MFNMSCLHTFSLIGIHFVEFPIRVWLSSMSVSRIIWIENLFWVEILLIWPKDFDQLGECNQDLVAPAPCHIPTESCGCGHSFRDSRTMSYALWSSECQNERAPALRENTFWSCVKLGRAERDAAGVVRRNETMKKFERGRGGAKWNCATKHERWRWRDEQIKKWETVWSTVQNWGTRGCQFSEKEWFVCGIARRRLLFC